MEKSSDKPIPLTPAIQRGYDFIRAQIASNVFKEGDSLPSINEVARLAGLSRVTMWKALKLLKKDGILQGHHSHNYSVPVSGQLANTRFDAAINPNARIPFKKRLVERIADRIKEDMVIGRFSNANTLPSLKELQEIYGVSYPTIHKSLNSLVDQQFLHIDRRKFAVSSHKRKKRSMRIVLFGFTQAGSTVMHGPLVGGSILREIETECSRQNISLVKQPYAIDDGELKFQGSTGNLQKMMTAPDTAGFINLIIQPFALSEELIFQLTQTRKPVAILDGAGGWMLPRTSFTRQTIRIFNYLIGSNCGVQAGRYLLDYGHRHIAYVSPYDKALWSQTRLKGLRSIFDSSSSEKTSCDYYCLEGTKAARDYIPQSMQHGKIDYLKTHFEKWSQTVPREFASQLQKLTYGIFDYEHAYGEIRILLKPVFRRMLENKKVTCWVCANDRIARIAKLFLDENNVSVPGDISLLSFDDASWAFEDNITSYNFNIPSIVHALFNFILAPEKVKHLKGKYAIDIDGVITERGSVRAL